MSIIMIRKFVEHKKFQLVSNLCALPSHFHNSGWPGRELSRFVSMMISFRAARIIQNLYNVIMCGGSRSSSPACLSTARRLYRLAAASAARMFRVNGRKPRSSSLYLSDCGLTNTRGHLCGAVHLNLHVKGI